MSGRVRVMEFPAHDDRVDALDVMALSSQKVPVVTGHRAPVGPRIDRTPDGHGVVAPSHRDDVDSPCLVSRACKAKRERDGPDHL